MQLESLKMFCDVVETGSFSKAAQLNRVTQSAISQQIRALENRFEQKLLSRSPRQVTPTSVGERLFRGCKEILARFAEVEQEVTEQGTEISGIASISTIYSVGLHELKSIQKTLLKTHPKVNLRLSYRLSDQVYDDVIVGTADVGIVAYPQPRAGVDVIKFRNDKLALVCAPTHPFASKPKIAIAALSEVPFIAFERETPTRKGVDRLLRELGLELKPVIETENVETIKRAVEMGLGVAILPSATVQHQVRAGTLVTKPFAEGSFSRPIGLLVRKGKYLSRAADAVLETFKVAARAEE